MKAKHFKKLRLRLKKYYVQHCYDLFGGFSSNDYYYLVMARNEREAVLRFLKRKRYYVGNRYYKNLDVIEQINSRFAKVRVLPVIESRNSQISLSSKTSFWSYY